MKLASTHIYFGKIKLDRQTPASDKGDVLVIWGSYMQKLCAMRKRANAHSSTFGFCQHAKPKQKTKRA